MKVLDLFCGMGGWSIGFHREGFECIGVDLVDVAYPYELILQDCRQFHANGIKPDVIIASPPCTEFSDLLFLGVARGSRGPGDPEKGMELVREAKRIIDEVQPQFWALENVRGSVEHISKLLGPPKMKHRPYYLWGKYPPFLLPNSFLGRKTIKETTRGSHSEGPRIRDNVHSLPLNYDTGHKPLQSYLRSKIPLPLSLGLAQACKTAILGGKP